MNIEHQPTNTYNKRRKNAYNYHYLPFHQRLYPRNKYIRQRKKEGDRKRGVTAGKTGVRQYLQSVLRSCSQKDIFQENDYHTCGYNRKEHDYSPSPFAFIDEI